MDKPKNGHRIQVLLGENERLRTEFLVACKRSGTTMSSAIVDFMKKYVRKNQPDQESNKLIDILK